MIQRSQRRKPAKPEPNRELLLHLHERLASRRLWFFRLVTASASALIVSFVLWLIRVPLTWHLLGIALSFIAGLFVQRPMKTWAIAWIRERVGLSYETALEQSLSKNADAFGFTDTLRQRATEEASRLTPPNYQAWWLPLLAIAFGLAFLPLIPSIPNLPTTFSGQPATIPTPAPSNQTANTVEPSPQTTPQTVAEPPSTGQPPSPANGETETSQLSEVAPSSTGNPNSNSQSADQEALGRFLDNLRESEQPQQDAPDTDLSSVMPQSSGNQSSNEDRASRPRSEQTNPFARPGQNQADEAQSGKDQSGQQNANENAQTGDAQQGQDEQNQGQEQQAQSDDGQSDSQSETAGSSSSDQGEQGQDTFGDSEKGAEEQSAQQSEQGSGENGVKAEGTGSEQSSDSGQNAEGAGSLPGAATAQSTEEVTGSSQQNPDFLPGQLSEGTNNIAGTVRLPGETGQTVFPEGSAPGSFNRAEEEALTEGRIPLEYQEVIRNYFRSSNP
jgi:hypothetical protein